MVGQDGADGAPVHRGRVRLRNLAGWLTLVPLVLLILFCSAQVSVWGWHAGAAQDVHSQLTADYEQWPYEEVAPMNPAVLDVIRREEGRAEGTEPVVPGIFLSTPTPSRTRFGAVRASATATISHTPSPVSKSTLISTTILPSQTRVLPSPTHTLTLVVASATLTAAPSATASLAPTWTSTAIPSATYTITLTPTRATTDKLVPTATRTRTSTRRPTRTASRTPTGTNTQLVSATPAPSLTVTHTSSVTCTATRTRTASATITITSIPSSTLTFTPVPVPTRTSTPTSTDTPVDTPAYTPTSTFTPTDFATSTYTPSPTVTLLPTDTPTHTPTATMEPTRIPLPPGMNIGPRDGSYVDIGCGGGIVVDLGSQTWIGQLVYYEVPDPSHPGFVAMDWVIASVSVSFDGPWAQIFYWGDSNPGNNGDIPGMYYPPEEDNQLINFGELYNLTGIRINVYGTYRYVLIEAPPGCDDPAQVDAIEVLP